MYSFEPTVSSRSLWTHEVLGVALVAGARFELGENVGRMSFSFKVFELDDFGLDLINEETKSRYEVSYFLMLAGEFLPEGDSAFVVEV